VPVTANKMLVAQAVEAQFGVTVDDVKMIVVKGKVKKSYQKRNRPVDGVRAKSKKAYVRLSEGSSINLFGEEEKAEAKPDKKADKKDGKKPAKAADKKEKK
jgi:ribosomal protein L23